MSIKSFVSDYAIAAFSAVVLLVLASVCLLFTCAIKSNRIKYAKMINAIPVREEEPGVKSSTKIPGKSKISSLSEFSVPVLSPPSGSSVSPFEGNEFKTTELKTRFFADALNGELKWAQKGEISTVYGKVLKIE